jgi:phage terminase large subunit-like protein
LKIKSFDPRVVTGSKPAGVLLDEVHVIAEQHDADRVIGQLRGGLISQPEGFFVQITTQSERAPAGVFRAELKKARAVRDGTLKAPILPLLYEFPEDVDWQDPANWWMVTPNRGRSITVERLVSEAEAAQAAGDEEWRRWASQHLNVQIGARLMSDRWRGADYWDEQGTAQLTLQEVLRRSEVVTIGIDGGGLDDMLGLAVIGRERETGNWLAWGRAWLHAKVLELRKSEAQRFRDFERDGDLRIIKEVGDDIDDLADIVEEVEDSGLLDRIGVDQAGIGLIVDAIVARKIAHDRIVGIPQGWRLMSAIKTAERKLAEGALFHGDAPLMAWCVGNAKVEPRGNAVMITKQQSGTAKIDPLMALFDAVALMAMNPKPRAKKYQMFVVGG